MFNTVNNLLSIKNEGRNVLTIILGLEDTSDFNIRFKLYFTFFFLILLSLSNVHQPFILTSADFNSNIFFRL